MKRLLDLLIPSRCAACGARGAPCCARCERVWGAAREVVRAPTAGVVRVFALARYRGVGRRLLIAYKERGRRDLAPSLGRVLAEALVALPLEPASPAGTRARLAGPAPGSGGPSPAGPSPRAASSGTASGPEPPTPPRPPTRAICLVPAPSRPSAARVRGGPHVERLANAAAGVLAARGIEVAVAPALELAASARDAVGLGREQRQANLATHLRFRETGRPPPGFGIVVLDDVITTGATAAACTRALVAAGFTVSAVLTLLAAG
ncbi:ComF family protein [Amycolatopsis sp. NPDC005003]